MEKREGIGGYPPPYPFAGKGRGVGHRRPDRFPGCACGPCPEAARRCPHGAPARVACAMLAAVAELGPMLLHRLYRGWNLLPL